MSKDVCQFYVVIGDNSFVAPNDGNVYINTTSMTDYKMIQDEIFRVYKEKAKLGISVGSEIIFLVEGISDSEKAKDIITKLRLNGKVELMKKEENKKKLENPEVIIPSARESFEVQHLNVELQKERRVNSVEANVSNKDVNVGEVNKNDKEASGGIVSQNEIGEIKQPANVYRRDFDGNNYSGYIGKPVKEKEKIGKLPLIIFIISLLLFVGSIILLFVL